jgi:hypothetical protein
LGFRAGDEGSGGRVAAPLSPSSVTPRLMLDRADAVLELDDEEIARQLTLLGNDIFQQVKPRELLSQAWAKAELAAFCPNVTALITHFNQVSLWTVHLVLSSEVLSVRVAVIAKLIGVMKVRAR